MPIDDRAIVSQTQAHEMAENMISKSPMRDFSPLKRADMIGKDYENILGRGSNDRNGNLR